MNKYLFSILFSSISIISCSQTKYGIKKIYAFSAERLPGNIPVDAQGNSLYKGPDTLNTIYIETSGKDIQWNSAWKNGKMYSINAMLIIGLPYEAGIKKSNNQKVLISAAPGSKLWQLELVPAEGKKKSPVKARPGEIILEGIYKGKKIIQKIDKQVELALPPSY